MWIADTTSDIQAFEASTLEGLSNNIATFYAENGDTICQIEAVYFEDHHGARSNLSKEGLDELCKICGELNEHLTSEAEAEAEADRENTSDFYNSIL